MKKMVRKTAAFSLIEVILALGVFLVTVLALVGLIGPTLNSVNEVESTDQVASVVSTVNSFLQDSNSIANPGQSTFETIYSGIKASDSLTVFVFQAYLDANTDTQRLRVGFAPGSPVNSASVLTDNDFDLAAGAIYRIVLSASSVLPESERSPTRSQSTQIYTLKNDYSSYFEGYLAYEVRIFEQQPSPNFEPDLLEPYESGMPANLESLAMLEPIFEYNGAIVR
ncbi:MAG: type IV pilus modification PilV family protein [Opitutales bacterium]